MFKGIRKWLNDPDNRPRLQNILMAVMSVCGFIFFLYVGGGVKEHFWLFILAVLGLSVSGTWHSILEEDRKHDLWTGKRHERPRKPDDDPDVQDPKE